MQTLVVPRNFYDISNSKQWWLSPLPITHYPHYPTDVERRFKQHKNGKGGHYTRSRGAIKILYHEKHKDRGSALRREAKIKYWLRARKLLLSKLKSRT